MGNIKEFEDHYNKACEGLEEKKNALLKELGIEDVRCGFHIGPGWFPVVAQTLRDMKEAGWTGKLAQVKQKFTGLRIYIDDADSKLYDFIAEAEKKCFYLCEICGGKRENIHDNFGMALCKTCDDLSCKEED